MIAGPAAGLPEHEVALDVSFPAEQSGFAAEAQLPNSLALAAVNSSSVRMPC